MNVQDRIRQQLSSSKIVLYMKGTPDFPQCGFSSRAVQLLKSSGAEFVSYDVLSDPEIRQGLKEFSNWPTFPQLYINGRLIGGSDIMAELYEKGELQRLINEAMQR